MGLYSTGWDQQNVVGNLVIQPLVFLGGVFYSVDALTQPWRALTHVDPIFYMVVAGPARACSAPPRSTRSLSVGVTLGLAAAMLGLGVVDLRPRRRDPHLSPPARR